MDKAFFFDRVYPFQDHILRVVNDIETGFYLTGGTAASRGYLHHRFSDDLDFFVNDDERFSLWSDRLIHALSREPGWRLSVFQKDERFVRCSIERQDLSMRIELVNDVPGRIGTVSSHEILGRLDCAENILANKITALLSREESKDLADVWGFCCKLGLSLTAALDGAQSKAAGIFPADLARILCSANQQDWEVIRWIEPPDADSYLADLRKLGEGLIL